MIRKNENPTSSALFGIAIFQALIGLGGWTIYSGANHFGLFDWIVTFSGAYFFVLAIIARFRRLTAAIIGSSLYAVYLGYQACHGMQFMLAGFLVIKLPVVLLLVYALITAFQHSHAKAGLPDSN